MTFPESSDTEMHYIVQREYFVFDKIKERQRVNLSLPYFLLLT